MPPQSAPVLSTPPGSGTQAPSQAGLDATTDPSEQSDQIQYLSQQLQSALSEIGKLRQLALAESQSHQSLSGLASDENEGVYAFAWLNDLSMLSAASETNPATTDGSIWRPAWDGFRRGFVLAYGIRAGLGTMTRALALYKEGKYQDMRGWRLVSERGLQ